MTSSIKLYALVTRISLSFLSYTKGRGVYTCAPWEGTAEVDPSIRSNIGLKLTEKLDFEAKNQPLPLTFLNL